MAETTKFKDAVAIVTGACSGIGRALVEAPARRGAFVVATDLSAAAAAAAGGAMCAGYRRSRSGTRGVVRGERRSGITG